MIRVLSVLALAVVLAAVQSCVPPDCDHNSCGGCGNACCLVGFRITSEMTSTQVNDAIVTSLKSGGADGRYTFVGDEDLRQYKIPDGTQFLLQAIHSTKVHHYNDTLNFAIGEHAESGHVMVRGFSISQIYGAYCDDGQNYKNVVGFIKGVTTLKWESEIMHGCTNKTHPDTQLRNNFPMHRLPSTGN
eukprot:scpid90609/ scgid32690/ 